MRKSFLPLLVTAATGACGADSAQPEAITPDDWRFGEAVLSIGELEGPPAQVFQFVSDVRILRHGRIAVADGRREVRVFDAAGAHLRTLSGPGDGPTEVRFLNRLLKEGDSILVLHDSGRRRLLRFLDDGTFLGGTSLGSVPVNVTSGLAVARHGIFGLRSTTGQAMDAEGQMRLPTSVILWTQRTGERQVRQARAEELTFKNGSFFFTPLGVRPFVGAWAGGAAFTPGDSSFVDFYDSRGRFINRVHTNRVSREITPATVDRWKSERRTLLEDRGVGADLVFPFGEEPAWAERLPVYDRLRPAGAYCVWARAYPLSWDTSHTYDVIHARWGHIAQVTVPSGWDIRDVWGRSAAILARDSLGVPRVEIRELQGNGVGACDQDQGLPH